MDLKKSKDISELRQDPVSKDWVIISTNRSKRPSDYRSSFPQDQDTPIDLCPFENPEKFGNEIIKTYRKKGSDEWAVKVIKNKYPIASGDNCLGEERRGPYIVKTQSSGSNEVVITRDHRKSFASLSVDEIEVVFEAYRDRFESLKKEKCVSYVLVFHNHGREAGASISHPHSQILAIPFIPSDVKKSLSGSRKYFSEKGRCVHCDILDWELKQKKRIIFENSSMAAFVPYAPDFSFEIRIFPKKHQSCFEETGDIRDLAEALKVSLAKIYSGLGNPAYNFFIHTAPVEAGEEYCYYHWHLEINPRTSAWGGFELGTGGDVISIDPDDVAEYLKDIKI